MVERETNLKWNWECCNRSTAVRRCGEVLKASLVGVRSDFELMSSSRY
jgi:hypothetical protein